MMSRTHRTHKARATPSQEEKFAKLVNDSARLPGRCLCGAEGELTEVRPHYFEYVFNHARRCPALHGGKL